jgi:nicotinate-nucleotide--dimethylbenzimidazole phosphoribosyltransferase
VAWPRPVPTIGDPTSSAQRAADPRGWAFDPARREAFYQILTSRRDVRRFRPDPVPDDVIGRVLSAAHSAPSVGHSQPWRFVLVRDPVTRQRAAVLADQQRLAQAGALDEESGRQLLDLDLEGIREAPLGIVVCCDRRAAPLGVLGRATFVDADVWSCVCAVQNMWLSARAEGLGVGWVTLFQPSDLAALVGSPEGVLPLGWFCVGWPDERPPGPGLERRAWSRRLALHEVVLNESWPAERSPAPPVSRLRPPTPGAVVGARDQGDRLLSAPGSLGALDRAVDRVVSVGVPADARGTLVLVGSDHPVAGLGVSAYSPEVTRHVADAAVAGQALGVVLADWAGLSSVVVDAGVEGSPVPGARILRPEGPRGDLVDGDALSAADVERLLAGGAALGAEVAGGGIVALGEVGVGNTTVAAALAAVLLDQGAAELVGTGAGADHAMVDAKRAVVDAVRRRAARRWPGGFADPRGALALSGGPEIAVLAGVVLGAAGAGAAVITDGLVTSVAALVALRLDPATSAYLVAGQRSRERGHQLVLAELGLEPLLDLRIRAGEGVGAVFASRLLAGGLHLRAHAARVADPVDPYPGSDSWPGPTSMRR